MDKGVQLKLEEELQQQKLLKEAFAASILAVEEAKREVRVKNEEMLYSAKLAEDVRSVSIYLSFPYYFLSLIIYVEGSH